MLQLPFHHCGLIKTGSIERVQQYLNIEQEPKPTAAGVPPAYWPASGDLRVEGLSARYSAVRILFQLAKSIIHAVLQDGPKVLHDLTFTIKSGERIGIGKLLGYCFTLHTHHSTPWLLN